MIVDYLKNLFDSYSDFSELFRKILIGKMHIIINLNNYFHEKTLYSCADFSI